MLTSEPQIRVVHPCIIKWRRWIDEAEQAGSFTQADREAAASWRYCAVGEAWEKRPDLVVHEYDDPQAKPTDPYLCMLGYDFNDAVKDDNFSKARDLITQIEQRLTELDTITP